MRLVWSAIEKDSYGTPIEIGVCVTESSLSEEGSVPILGMAGFPVEADYDGLEFDEEPLELYQESGLLDLIKNGIGFSLKHIDIEIEEFVNRFASEGQESGQESGLRYAGRDFSWDGIPYLLSMTDAAINNWRPLDLDDFSEFIELAGLSGDLEPRLKTPPAGRAVENAKLDLLEYEYYLKILHTIPLTGETP